MLILVIDDNQKVCIALSKLFDVHGYRAVCANSPSTAVELASSKDISLIIQDMNFGPGEIDGERGKHLFYTLHKQLPQVPIILMTAWADVGAVVELIKAGAHDYVTKPWDDQRLLLTVENALKLKSLSDFKIKTTRQNAAKFKGKSLCGLIFSSPEMERLVQMALQISPSNASILITGPNGAGKEGIADIIHANSSRHQKPFIKVNMGALPQDLMEAELFGVEAGAYSGATKSRMGRFEVAHGGTLFLDEIGNLSLAGQAKLLRVLQTGEFERLGSTQTRKADVRIISATNSDLKACIANGKFREDLYYRINVVQLDVPPLCKRPDDIIPLAKSFLGEGKRLSRAASLALLEYTWPGNVRELYNVCQRASLLSEHAEISIQDLALPAVVQVSKPSLDDLSKEQIEAVLSESNGIISRAAKSLGLSRQALYRRMEYYGITL